MSREIAGYN